MDKRKVIILAIVLFLFIGLGTFVFAQNGSDENGNGQRNNTIEAPDNNGVDNGQDGSSGEPAGNQEGEGGQDGQNTGGTGEEPGEEPAGPGTPETPATDGTVSAPGTEGGESTTPSTPETPENPDTPVDNTKAELLAALKAIQEKIDKADAKDDIDSARTDRTEDLVAAVEKLNDPELNELLAEINKVLDDTTNPVLLVNGEEVENGSTIYVNEDAQMSVDEDNLLTFTSNGNDRTDNVLAGSWTAENDGPYNIVVTDKAFNQTTYTIVVDRTNPTISVDNAHHFGKDEEAIVDVEDSILDRVVVNNQDTKESFTLYDEDGDGVITVDLSEYGDATYHIYTYDKAQNEQDYWVAVDTTDAEISFVETDKEDNVLTDLTNKDVTIKVFDKFLTDVTVTYPNGETITYTYANKNDEYYESDSGNENRTFRLDVEEEGTYVVTARDKVGNVTDAIEITIDKTIDMRHLYTLNSTYVNDSTWNGDNYYKVIGDGQTLTVELVFNEEIVGTPQIAIGTSQDYEDMVCYEPSWAKVKCNATITIDGENQGLVDGKEIPISIKNVQDKAENTTTYTIDHIKTTSDYGKVVYDNTPIKYNAVTAYVNDGAEGEYIEEENAIKFYATYGDRIIAYITTAEKLAEMPVFTLTYGENEIVLTGDDVNIYDTNHETYKYRYQVVYTVPEDFEKIEAEAVLTVTNVVDGAGNDTINHDGKREKLTVTNPYRVYIDTIAPEIELYRNNDTTSTNLVTGLDEYNRFNFYVGVKANDTYGISNITVNDEEYDNNSFGVSNDVKDYVVVAADKAGNKTEIQFTIDTKYPIVEINGTQYQKTINNIRVDEANIKIIEDNISSLIVTKDGQKLSDYDSTTTKFTLREEGLYTIEVKDNNKNGNKTTVEFYVGKYDTEIVFDIPDSFTYDANSVEGEITAKLVNKITGETIKENLELTYFEGNMYGVNRLESAPTDAGTYTVSAYFYEDADNKTAHATAVFEIEMADTSIVLSEPSSYVYDGNAKEFTANVIDEHGNPVEENISVKYYKDGYTPNNALTEAPVNAGNYIVAAYYAESNNYNASHVQKAFEIEKALTEIKFTIPDNIFYDGEPVDDIEISVVANGKEIANSETSKGFWINYYNGPTANSNNLIGTEAPTNAGNYWIAVNYVDSTGNYTNAWDDAEFTIVADTTKPDVGDLENNAIYFGNIPYYMTDENGIDYVYYDFSHNYTSCSQLINAYNQGVIDRSDVGGLKAYPENGAGVYDVSWLPSDKITGVSFCAVDKAGNDTFVGGITIYKNANATTVVEAINNGGNITIPSNVAPITISGNSLSIPANTYINGNKLLTIIDTLNIANDYITISYTNITGGINITGNYSSLENSVISGAIDIG